MQRRWQREQNLTVLSLAATANFLHSCPHILPLSYTDRHVDHGLQDLCRPAQ